MPITGLSDRESLDPRFKEIGRIRKGAEKSGNQPGEDLDWFRYVPDKKYPESAAVFRDLYGDEPTSLEVFFPFNEMERVFSSWREAYGQSRLCKIRCDGSRWHDWIEGNRHYHSDEGRACTLEYKDVENKCPNCPLAYNGKLSIVLRPMWEAGQIGIVTVITSSINDIAVLASKLVQYEPLAGKPFTLWREPRRIGVPIKDKRVGVDKSLLNLELTEERLLLEFRATYQHSVAQIEAQATPDLGRVDDAIFDELPPFPDDEAPEPEPVETEPAPPEWDKGTLVAIVKKKMAEDEAHAKAALGLSQVVTPEDKPARLVAWMSAFRSQVDQGKSTGDAAKMADSLLQPRE